MKKTILYSAALLFTVLATSSSVSAYGGGGGFPPGYYHQHHGHFKCEWKKTKYAGNKIKIPVCKVERGEREHHGKDLKHRINDFIGRVRHGGR